MTVFDIEKIMWHLSPPMDSMREWLGRSDDALRPSPIFQPGERLVSLQV
jgi:hypothetical protein